MLKRQIAESVVPFDMSFNRRCPGIFASPCPCIGFNESNYKECKFNSIETICEFSLLYRELEDISKNRKYLTYNEKREISLACTLRYTMIINTQPEKTKCLLRQPGHNCPLDNKGTDLNTFCEAWVMVIYAMLSQRMNPVEDDYRKIPIKVGTDYKIKITSTSNSAYKDTSNSNFRIS